MSTPINIFRRKAPWLIALAVIILVLLGLRYSASILKGQVIGALGPEAEIQSIHLGWFSVEVDHLLIHAPSGWPAPETLRAERITILPDLRSLFSDKIRIYSITVDHPYLSMRRTADGSLEVLPSLLKRNTSSSGQSKIVVAISKVALEDGVLDFFDASVAQPALKLRIEKMKASVDDLLLPALDGNTKFDLSGTVQGVQHDGTLELSGWVNVPAQDSSIKTKLHGVDLVKLQPYLIKTHETGVKQGALDLELQSTVEHGKLKAPGKLTLSQLQLAPGAGLFDTFMGVPRQTVISALKDRDGKIDLDFQLDGDIHNPQFSLNEVLSVRLTFGVAQSLGLSVAGLVEGVGSLGVRGIGAAGSAVGKLFGIGQSDDTEPKK